MALDPGALPQAVLGFLSERHLATLTTVRADGTPHVVPVGFAFDPGPGVVRVITGARSQKAANAARGGRAVVCQIDGARWVALEGRARVTDEAQRVAAAVAAYTTRYRPPRDNPDRVAIEITVDRVLAWASLVRSAHSVRPS